MFCPNQECPDRLATGEPGEYRAGIGECPYCGTRLVDSLSEASNRPGEEASSPRIPDEFEAVLETSDPSEIPILESILNGAEIPFLLEGMESFRAFSGGNSPMRYSPRGGTVVIVVPADRAEEARALLTESEPE